MRTEERGAMILYADFIPSQQEILRFCRINEIMDYQ